MHSQQDRHGSTTTQQRLQVQVNVLGGFAVTVGGTTTSAHAWSRRPASALVKVLALAPGHRVHREQILDLLWPHEPPERSAPRLHKAAHFARRAAGRLDAVVLRGDVVSLFPGADITVDALEFERLARLAVQRDDAGLAREALSWYDGELLPDDRYEDWAADRRELLALRQLDVLRVAGEWRELAELDPTHEEAHLQLMQRQIGEGDVVAAVRQYDHLASVLERELGVQPNAAVRAARHHAGTVLELGLGLDLAPGTGRLDRVLAELTGLVHRQSALLAELSRRCGYRPEILPKAVGA